MEPCHVLDTYEATQLTKGETMRATFKLPLTGHRIEISPTPKPHAFRFPNEPVMQALVDEALSLGIRADFYRKSCKQIRQLIADSKAK